MKIIKRLESYDLDRFILNFRDENKFLGYCQKCDNYGKCWTCPPYDFSPSEFLSRFSKLEVLLTLIDFDGEEISDKESFKILDIEKKSLYLELIELEKSRPGSRVFYPGSCIFCPRGQCAKAQNLSCRHPEKLRYSLESFGFDIGKILKEVFNEELLWAHDGLAPAHYTLVSALLF